MYPGSPIEAGSTDEAAVKKIQTRLKALGVDPALEADGDFGPSTEAAVKLFQARALDPNGDLLLIDGVVGPTTWAALFGEKIEKVKAAGGPLLDAVIAKAKSQVGKMENPLGSNRGPEVDEYLKRVGLDSKRGSYAWCAAFVYWCFDEAAKEIGKTNPAPKTAGVLEMWRQAGAKSLKRYTPGQARANPALVKPGQLFFLDTGSGTGHVGLIIGVEGMALTTVEGNTTEITGSREGIGVFKRKARRIGAVNLGFADFSQTI